MNKITITAISMEELESRVSDMKGRGWQLKQIVPDAGQHHFGDYTLKTGRLNKQVIRASDGFPKHRAVMIKDVTGDE